MNLAQRVNDNDNIHERITQGRDLEGIISQVPTFLTLSHALGDGDPALFFNHVLLDVFLRRPLLRLYRPILTSQHHDNHVSHHAERAFIESCNVVLSYQDSFGPSLSHINELRSTSYWDMFQGLLWNDMLFAALGVCEHMRQSNQHSRELSPSIETRPGNIVLQSIHNTSLHTRLVEDTLGTMTRPTGNRDVHVKDIFTLDTGILVFTRP